MFVLKSLFVSPINLVFVILLCPFVFSYIVIIVLKYTGQSSFYNSYCELVFQELELTAEQRLQLSQITASTTTGIFIIIITMIVIIIIIIILGVVPDIRVSEIVFGHELGTGSFSSVRFCKRIVRGLPQAQVGYSL